MWIAGAKAGGDLLEASRGIALRGQSKMQETLVDPMQVFRALQVMAALNRCALSERGELMRYTSRRVEHPIPVSEQPSSERVSPEARPLNQVGGLP